MFKKYVIPISCEIITELTKPKLNKFNIGFEHKMVIMKEDFIAASFAIPVVRIWIQEVPYVS